MKRQHLLFLGIISIFCVIVCWYFLSRPSESVEKVQQQKAKQTAKASRPKSASQGATTNALTRACPKNPKFSISGFWEQGKIQK